MKKLVPVQYVAETKNVLTLKRTMTEEVKAPPKLVEDDVVVTKKNTNPQAPVDENNANMVQVKPVEKQVE